MSFAKHKLGTTHFTKKGKKSKNTPLIWCHGGPGGQHNPKGSLFQLSNERQTIAYTQIGGGKSSALKRKDMKISTFVRELQLLIDYWKLKEFHLGGGSWGTTLALEYALRTKDKRIKSLIFQSPMFSAKMWENDAKKLIRNMKPEDQKIIRYCHEINATDSKVYQEAMKKFYLKHVLRNEKQLTKMLSSPPDKGEQVYKTMWGASEFSPTGTLKNYDRVKDLKKIKLPTLFIAGEHDEATPKSTEFFSKKIKNSEFVMIKGVSHSIMRENPKKMLPILRRFLKKHD